MAADDQDIMTPTELGQKLVIALRSVSDPQALMQAIADRTASTLRTEMSTRIDAMDRATNLWHEDLVRVPTDVQKAVGALRDVMEQVIQRTMAELDGRHGREIERLHGEIATLTEVSEERFKSIQTQFALLKQATEQLDLANKVAIAAALQAQKESAGETQKSSQAAIAKSELSTAEAIKALTASNSTQIAGLTDRYKDYTSTVIAVVAVGLAALTFLYHQGAPLGGQADNAVPRQLLEQNNALIQRLQRQPAPAPN
jgi:hypothetical protein